MSEVPISETKEVAVGRFDELGGPGCREFSIGDGDWPFKGFVVRQEIACSLIRITAGMRVTR